MSEVSSLGYVTLHSQWKEDYMRTLLQWVNYRLQETVAHNDGKQFNCAAHVSRTMGDQTTTRGRLQTYRRLELLHQQPGLV